MIVESKPCSGGSVLLQQILSRATSWNSLLSMPSDMQIFTNKIRVLKGLLLPSFSSWHPSQNAMEWEQLVGNYLLVKKRISDSATNLKTLLVLLC
jgi:hypothetical protein